MGDRRRNRVRGGRLDSSNSGASDHNRGGGRNGARYSAAFEAVPASRRGVGMKPRHKVLAVCVMLSQLALSAAAASEPVAIVSELQGSATVTEGGKARGLQVYDWLTDGASVTVAKGSSVVLVLASGARFSVKENARVTVRRTGLRTSSAVQALPSLPPLPVVAPIASATGSARGNAASSTVSGAIRIRGSSIRNLYPSGHTTIADHTTLRFVGLRGVTAYLVTIEDEKRSTILEQQIEREELLVPPGVLEPGRRYTWRVTVVGDPVALPTTGTFVTLPALTAQSRSALRSSLRADQPGSLILMARID